MGFRSRAGASAGSRIRQVENYVGGETADDQNRTTDWTYNADGRTASLKAVNAATEYHQHGAAVKTKSTDKAGIERNKWAELLTDVQFAVTPTVTAVAYEGRKWESAARPATFICDDGGIYVVKGPQAGRMAVNEHVACKLSAPIVDSVLVNLLPALIDTHIAQIGYFAPGLGHGTKLLPDCSERAWVQQEELPENLRRFALLAILFAWLGGGDFKLV